MYQPLPLETIFLKDITLEAPVKENGDTGDDGFVTTLTPSTQNQSFPVLANPMHWVQCSMPLSQRLLLQNLLLPIQEFPKHFFVTVFLADSPSVIFAVIPTPT